MTKANSSARLGSVDALRALAVIPVILFHLNESWLPGGYLGVDVFFVISGYLITGILAKEISGGTFHLGDFYLRRVRRILPALLVMLITVTLVWLCIEPWMLGQVAKLARASLSLRANLAIKELVGDYWGAGAQAQPLLHTWSLAVEEQFYLVFPLVFWITWRFLSRPLAFAVLVLLAGGSVGWYSRCWSVAPNSAFYDTASRAWELLSGSLLATILPYRHKDGNDSRDSCVWVGWLGLSLVFAAYASPAFGISHEWRPAIAVVGAAAFLWAAPGRSGVHAILDQRPIVYLGAISYSLYLWHWPVIVFSRNLAQSGSSEWSVGSAEIFLIFALGATSYHLVEKPFRHGLRRAWLILLACVVAYFAIRQLARGHEKSWTNHIEKSVLPVSQVTSEGQSYQTVGGFRQMSLSGQAFAENVPMTPLGRRKYRHIALAPKDARPTGQLVEGGETRSPETMLVWGDSHAMVMAPTLNALARELGVKALFRIKEGEEPFVMKSSSGDGLAHAAYRALQARPTCCVLIFRYDTRSFSDYEATFSEILKHTKLIVIQQPPVLDIPDVCTVDYFAYLRDVQRVDLKVCLIKEQPRAVTGRQAFERQMINKFGSVSGFSFVRLDGVLKDTNGRPRWWDTIDALYYIDDDHLSEFGTHEVAPLIRSAIERSKKSEK